MQGFLKDIIRISGQTGGPKCEALESDDARISYGFISTPDETRAHPILNGFPILTETVAAEQIKTLEALKSYEDKTFGDDTAYRDFLELKLKRPAYDAYAYFQPFNESWRALIPFVPHIREHLKPGDIILDLWNRSGWTGSFLAGLFPHNPVVSVWENTANVLGYRGFRHWLSPSKRLPNLDIVFHSPNEPFPFADKSFALIVGYDSLHRYDHENFIPECFRVSRPDAAMFFPHIHFSNQEPDPYFERGGHYHSSEAYQTLFDQHVEGTNRSAFVYSEAELFDMTAPQPIASTPHGNYYNGFVAILPKSWRDKPLSPELDVAARLHDHLIVNPLLQFDLNRGTYWCDDQALLKTVDHLFYRHPVYAKRIADVDHGELTPLDCQVIFLANRGYSVETIFMTLGLTAQEMEDRIRHLRALEIVQRSPAGDAQWRLQRYYPSMEHQEIPDRLTFVDIWRQSRVLYAETPLLETPDGTRFSLDDAETIINALRQRWHSRNLSAGDTIAIHSEHHPEYILTIWAAWLSGLVVVPLDPNMPPQELGSLLDDLSPQEIFVDPPRAKALESARTNLETVTCFDTLAGDSDHTTAEFADSIEPFLEHAPLAYGDHTPDHAACILFTSGSTGTPKGVVLSHSSLSQTGHLLATTYGFKQGDKMLSLGVPYAMSALRNPCVASLRGGATICVPDPGMADNILSVVECCQKSKITILCTVPRWLELLDWTRTRNPEILLESVRLALVTGTSLSHELADKLGEALEMSIIPYYGLTETGGICTAAMPDESIQLDGMIGHPVGAVVQLVDEANSLIREDNTLGEIRVFSTALLSSYWQNRPELNSRLKDGWLYTGDMALRYPTGALKLVGRKDDQAKSPGGDIIFTSEIESTLKQHDAVFDAGVYCGIRSNDRIIAFVKKDAERRVEEAELKNYVLKKLGRNRVPHKIDFVDTLPRGNLGKIKYDELVG